MRKIALFRVAVGTAVAALACGGRVREGDGDTPDLILIDPTLANPAATGGAPSFDDMASGGMASGGFAEEPLSPTDGGEGGNPPQAATLAEAIDAYRICTVRSFERMNCTRLSFSLNEVSLPSGQTGHALIQSVTCDTEPKSLIFSRCAAIDSPGLAAESSGDFLTPTPDGSSFEKSIGVTAGFKSAASAAATCCHTIIRTRPDATVAGMMAALGL